VGPTKVPISDSDRLAWLHRWPSLYRVVVARYIVM